VALVAAEFEAATTTPVTVFVELPGVYPKALIMFY